MNFELNPFEIKTEINKIFIKLKNVKDFGNMQEIFETLDSQNDKKIVVKMLFREISNPNNELVKFLLERYCPKAELTERLWEIIKNNLSSSQAKIFALDFLREIDTNWTYEDCEQYFNNPDEIIDADTKKILNNAILNPEVQVDFLDFLHSISEKDQIILLESLANDYKNDEFANMLIPVYFSMYKCKTGLRALELLGESKSQLALNALTESLEFVDKELLPVVNKNISILKISGIREPNTEYYYKNILKDSKPFRFCITYPDGHGNQAIIISRKNYSSGKIQFVAIVIDDYRGIRDCFGFNEISEFECNAIIDRFYRGERAIEIKPEILKSILLKAEKLSVMPYEYACWRNVIGDIEPVNPNIEHVDTKITNRDFEHILQSDFTDYWFLNEKYSDEFEQFTELTKSFDVKEYDRLIDENLEKVFFPSEFKIWSERILNTSILKYFAGDKKESDILYTIYKNKDYKREFLKNILRKSLYEYYYSKNDSERVKSIEEIWVK